MTSQKVTINGVRVNFDAAVNLMDDDIREKVHMTLSPCGTQTFVDRYVKIHKAKYGEVFVVN